MSAHGQLDLEGNEQTDPRLIKAGQALWWADARRTWGRDGEGVARENAKRLWPRMAKSYVATAEVALRAAGVL